VAILTSEIWEMVSETEAGTEWLSPVSVFPSPYASHEAVRLLEQAMNRMVKIRIEYFIHQYQQGNTPMEKDGSFKLKKNLKFKDKITFLSKIEEFSSSF
jgi:hypothetical protein